MDDLQIAIEAAKRAGAVHKKYFQKQGLQITAKSSASDLLTDADLAADKAVAEAISEIYPTDSILSEENTTNPLDGRQWVVDPLDGTTNFARGVPFFCASVALKIDRVTEVGAVYDAVHDELFAARRGQGATLNGISIYQSKSRSIEQSLVSTHAIRDPEIVSILADTGSVHDYGSFALEICYLACGRLDALLHRKNGAMLWDWAAGELIAEEAGVPARDTEYDAYLIAREPLLSRLKDTQ